MLHPLYLLKPYSSHSLHIFFFFLDQCTYPRQSTYLPLTKSMSMAQVTRRIKELLLHLSVGLHHSIPHSSYFCSRGPPPSFQNRPTAPCTYLIIVYTHQLHFSHSTMIAFACRLKLLCTSQRLASLTWGSSACSYARMGTYMPIRYDSRAELFPVSWPCGHVRVLGCELLDFCRGWSTCMFRR